MQEWERDQIARERIRILREMKQSHDQERRSAAFRRLSGKPGIAGELQGMLIQNAIVGGIMVVLAMVVGIIKVVQWALTLFNIY
jgi:hypothetical protein